MTQADTVLLNGRIFCGLAEGFAEALAIAGGKVLAVGSVDEIAALQGAGTKVVDLAGRVAIPGLNDAHMHLLPLGLAMGEVNLRPEEGVASIDEILRRVAMAAKARKPGEWVIGRGYDHNELAERRHPTAEELDRAAPDNPVYIKRTCGHVGVVNGRALQAAGIGHNTPSPAGGLIERRDNRLTGLLAESAMRLVVEAMPAPSLAELKAAIVKAGHYMLSQGFTSVMDAAVGMTAGMAEIDAYEEVARAGTLPVRTWVCIYGNADGIGDEAHAAGYRFGRETGLLRYGAMKVFGDGSAGGLTAAMSEPYLVGDPDNRGIFIYSDAQMHGYLAHFHELGYQLAIHAIGDAAIEQVLAGIEKADSAEHPIKGRRHRIEHCGFLTEAQLARMAAAGIDPVPQPAFIYEFGDLYVTNLGRQRADASYPMRKWLDAGLHAAASSDAPVCATDPFKNLFTMVTRETKRHTVIGGGERLSMAEAVHAYTLLGAYTQFAEDKLGRLVPGQLADIAVLSHDIFSVPVETVENAVCCDLTLLGGEIVFDRHGQLAAAAQ
ncbi:MAG: amidohydrolase [Bosea sp.]|uniref:amidohydrolase n=1 Tax=unclassified Bosea (in: a-proteobacteria) TaxID=2653178 RepID=UPI000965F166|nr:MULTISPECIES: amidohydrolase [unclassified Bosea (in: a-proteobacteria)]MBN9459076.1 amidohydrolase [Bosea sp. (in: a-proteobacteria)]OJV06565.1 MAG: amidohydrolase [Bosea sp. 67-29]